MTLENAPTYHQQTIYVFVYTASDSNHYAKLWDPDVNLVEEMRSIYAILEPSKSSGRRNKTVNLLFADLVCSRLC